MIKFFRRIRQRLITENRFNKYLIYALGEIVLVVIGILIALQINNWNENRKDAAHLNSILAIFFEDILNDIKDIERVVNHYESKEIAFLKIMNDSITKEEFKELQAPNLITYYQSFTFEQRALNQIIDVPIKRSADTLVSNLIELYNQSIEYSNMINMSNKQIMESNIQFYMNNFYWYPDWILDKENQAIIESLYSNQEYKNRLSHSYLYIYQNYVPTMKEIKIQLKSIIKVLEKRLKKTRG